MQVVIALQFNETHLSVSRTAVMEEGKSLPRFGDVYPKVKFVDEEKWAEKNKEVSKGLSGLSEYIKTNADSIKEQRKKNGIEGKY